MASKPKPSFYDLEFPPEKPKNYSFNAMIFYLEILPQNRLSVITGKRTANFNTNAKRK